MLILLTFSQNNLELFSQELVHQVDKLWQEYQALRAWMSELMEIQRDNIASKTGERINRLTILSTIFLPITFMSGFYGMNFKYMPELEQPWAYPAVICVMALIIISSITYAKNNIGCSIYQFMNKKIPNFLKKSGI